METDQDYTNVEVRFGAGAAYLVAKKEIVVQQQSLTSISYACFRDRIGTVYGNLPIVYPVPCYNVGYQMRDMPFATVEDQSVFVK